MIRGLGMRGEVRGIFEEERARIGGMLISSLWLS